MGSRLASAVREHPLIAIWILAFGIRGLYVLRSPEVFFGDAVDYDAMARSLLDGRGFYVEAVGFIRPPLYPLFVALCYVIGGLPIVQLVQIVLGASTATL